MDNLKITQFFNYELSHVPPFLRTCLGSYFNNGLCNGATWFLLMWSSLYFVYSIGIEKILLKFKIKHYLRQRLQHSLWYFGFFAATFFFTSSWLFENRTIKKISFSSARNVPSSAIASYLLLFTFYVHSTFVELVYFNNNHSALCYALLSLLSFTAVLLRNLDVLFAASALLSIPKITLESLKILDAVAIDKSNIYRQMLRLVFGLSLSLFTIFHIIGVPLFFLVPFVKIITAVDASFYFFVLVLICWYVAEMNNSVVNKLMHHYLFHKVEDEEDTSCNLSYIDCCLFLPREDDAYIFKTIDNDIQFRENRRMGKRKQTNKTVLLQTLKCMMTLKKRMQGRGKPQERAEAKTSLLVSEPKNESDDVFPLVDNNKATLVYENPKPDFQSDDSDSTSEDEKTGDISEDGLPLKRV